MSPRKADSEFVMTALGKEEVPIGDGVAVRMTLEGVELVRYKDVKGELYESTTKVIMGSFKPVRKLILDGEEVFEIMTTFSFRGNAEEVHQELRRQGLVVNRAKAADAVNALFQGLDLPVEQGHAAYGVFNNSSKATLCLEPYPRTESQEQIARQVGKYVGVELSREDLEAWFEVLNFWLPFEVLPAMGLSIMAPFALELRRRGVMFGYLYHLSPESGLGKTEVSRIFTRRLYGNELLSADSVKSEYRLMDCLDSAGLMIAVQEAETLSWERFSAHLQMAAEQPLQDKRGTPGLGSRPYWSRAVLLFTGNHFPTKRKALLVRFLVVEFDRTKLVERRKRRKELRGVVKKLKPVGFRVVEAELESLDSIDELVGRIEGHGDMIEELYPGCFEDPRRPTLWGIVYEGLRAWERAAVKTGVDWMAPTIEEFVGQVVNRVEPTAFQSVEVPAAGFISWWQAWKALNTVERDGVPSTRGEGRIWDEDTLNGVEGDVITKSVLTIYEKECKASGTIPINSLPDLARGIEALYGLPFSEVYKVRRIGDKTPMTVFIPKDEKIVQVPEINVTTKQNEKTGTGEVLSSKNSDSTSSSGTENEDVEMLSSKSPPVQKKFSG